MENRSALGRRAGIIGIACNLALFAMKLLVGTLSHSLAITADAVNNLSDASGSMVTFLGFKLAEKPADSEHPYGHARVEYIAGLGVAVFILLIGWELAKSSIDRILHPAPVEFTPAVFAVLLGSILTKLFMALYYRKVGQQIHSPTLEAASADSRNDVVSTLAVLIAGIVGHYTPWNVDGPMGLGVAVFILLSGIGIAKDTIDPLLGKAPDPELERSIAGELTSRPEVLGFHDLMLHDYGPGKCFGSVHVELDMHKDPLAAHELIDSLELACHEKFGVQLCIHHDPMVTDDPKLNKLKAAVLACVRDLDSRMTAHDFRMARCDGRDNLIFDLVIPYDRKKDVSHICAQVQEAVSRADPQCTAVITTDDAAFNRIPEEKE